MSDLSRLQPGKAGDAQESPAEAPVAFAHGGRLSGDSGDLGAAVLAKQAASLQNADRESVLGTLARSAVYTFAQAPVESAAQLLDGAFASNLERRFQFMQAPAPAAPGSPRWFAAQLGSAVGMAPWIIGLNKGVSHLIGAGAESGIFRRTAAWAGTGALFGGLLTPGDRKDLLRSRLDNAASSALTFGALSASNEGLGRLGVSNRVLSGFLSGVPAGLIQRQSQSLLSGQGLRFDSALAADIGTYSLVGAIAGLMPGKSAAAAPESRLAEVSAAMKDAGGDLPPIQPYELRSLGWRGFDALPWVQAIKQRFPEMEKLAMSASTLTGSDFLTPLTELWEKATPAERPYIREYFQGKMRLEQLSCALNGPGAGLCDKLGAFLQIVDKLNR